METAQITYDAEQQYWIVTGYTLGVEALHHPLLTTRHPEAEEIEQDLDDPMSLVFQQAMLRDGPPHMRIRTLLEPAIKRRVGQMQPLIHQIIPDLLHHSQPGPRDVERTFAAPLPLLSLAHLLGLHVFETRSGSESSKQSSSPLLAQPQLARLLTKLALWQRGMNAFGDLLTGYPSIEALEGAERLQHAVRRVLAQKRRRPMDDLATLCATAEAFQSEDERIGNFVMLFGAGSGTTTTLLLNGPVLLLQHQTQFTSLRSTLQAHPEMETSVLRNLEEELLRLVTPTQTVARWALEDLSLGNATIRKGSKVVLNLAAMNRDSTIFADPDQLDSTRQNARDHLAFGAGPHACPGRPLALLEILEVLKYLVVLRNLRLTPGQSLTYNYNMNQRRLKRALIEWDD